MGELTTLKILAEMGNDFSAWKTPSCYTAWLNLSPNTEITGGKVIKTKMSKKTNIAGQAIKQAGSTVSRCRGPMGDHARSLKKRLGKKSGSIAMAHKMSRIIYSMVTNQQEYDKDLIKKHNARNKEDKIRSLERRLAKLNRAS